MQFLVIELSAFPSLKPPPCCLPSDCPLYPTITLVPQSTVSTLLSLSAPMQFPMFLVSSRNAWQAAWLISFHAVQVGLQDSGPWFSSVKPSEAPATKASYVHMATWRPIAWESFIPTSRIDIARETTKSTNNKIPSAGQLQIIIKWKKIFFPEKMILKCLNHCC